MPCVIILEAMQLAPGVVIKSTYRLERPLAVGGMGALWVASHVALGSKVAVKFMDVSEADPVARARFQREAQSLAAIHNPHVVAVHDYGTEGDTPYIVMDLLDGEDLGTRLKRTGRLALPDVSRMLTQIGRGLRAAHAAGIVHRDLKPANVFLAVAEGEETVKILDFGLAKNAAAGAVGEGTKTGDLVGSPHYMSPEQIRSPTSIDQRSDLWSLSVILYRALSGELPFKGKQVGPVLAQILTDTIPKVTEVAPDLPPALDAFFARGLARDPAQRFHSAQEMAHELARIAVQAGYTEPPPHWGDPSSSGPSYSSGVTSISASLPGGAWSAAPVAPAPTSHPSASHPSTSHPSMSHPSMRAGNPSMSHPAQAAPHPSWSGREAPPPAAAASWSGREAPVPVPPGSLSGQLTVALVAPEVLSGQPVPPLATTAAPVSAPAKTSARLLWALGVAVVSVVLTMGVLVATLRSEPDAGPKSAAAPAAPSASAAPSPADQDPPASAAAAAAEPAPAVPSAASSTAPLPQPSAPRAPAAFHAHTQVSPAPAPAAPPPKKKPNWGF